ncbi:MAG: hypothetical protein ACRDJ5_00485, partial [Actinomycetota bacterium]
AMAPMEFLSPISFEHAKWLDEVAEGERIRFPDGSAPIRIRRLREDAGLISVIGVDDEGYEHLHTCYPFQGVFVVEEIPDTPPPILAS